MNTEVIILGLGHDDIGVMTGGGGGGGGAGRALLLAELRYHTLSFLCYFLSCLYFFFSFFILL